MNRSMCLLFAFVVLMLSGNISHADRNILWRKVNSGCIPGYISKNTYQPCSLVDMNKKNVIYKVDNDKYQYLLLPTDKVTGVEDDKLQRDGTPNYLYDAWLAKTFLTERLGKPIKERFISLTLNSKNARSQDQFHIHISCLSSGANEILSKIPESKMNSTWSKEQITIPPYSFYYRKVSLNELIHDNLFQSVSDKVKQEKGSLESTGVAMVNITPNSFIMLVGIGTSANGVSAELIQDHECRLAEQ
jgi:CDP-diacylglycerol pyrophosphatase